MEGRRLRRRVGLLLLARLAPARLLVTTVSQEAPAWDLVLRGRRGSATPRRFAGVALSCSSAGGRRIDLCRGWFDGRL